MAFWRDEEFEGEVRLGLRATREVLREQTAFQLIEIVETMRYGNALLLDGLYMTAEKEERTYHEMLVHPVLLTHPRPKRVLVIGGGDGGTIREVLRHPEVEHCTLVEIDEQVVNACKTHLPTLGGDAWRDPRLSVRFEDASAFVKTTQGPFDVVLLDGSDPVGPSAGLFGASFYQAVSERLAPGGIFGLQSESPTLMSELFFEIQAALAERFAIVHPYYANIPLYGASTWSFTWASQAGDAMSPDLDRLARLDTGNSYYNAEIHKAAFAQPNWIKARLTRD